MRTADYPNARRKWRRWINRITAQVSNLMWDDYYFRESLRAAEKGGYIEPGNEVYRLFVRMYVVHARIAIRRLLDRDKRTYSLRLLLTRMRENPQVITRKSFVSAYPLQMRDTAAEAFDKIAGPGAAHLPRSVPESLLRRLDAAEARLAAETDQQIAHHQRKRIPVPPRATFADIQKAIRVIDRAAIRTQFILTQVASDSCVPGNIDECRWDCWHVWAGKVRPKWDE